MTMSAVVAWFDKSQGFQVLRFHAVESETATFEVEVTERPVEVGADFTDHVRTRADTASISAVIVAKPLAAQSLTRDGFQEGAILPLSLTVPVGSPGLLAGGLASTIGRAISPPSPTFTIPALQFFTPKRFFEDVLKVLRKLQDDRTLVECMTDAWSVESAIIARVVPTAETDNIGGGRIDIDFKKIRKVRTKQSSVTIPEAPKAQKKIDLGGQGTKAAADKKVEKAKSALTALTGIGSSVPR